MFWCVRSDCNKKSASKFEFGAVNDRGECMLDFYENNMIMSNINFEIPKRRK